MKTSQLQQTQNLINKANTTSAELLRVWLRVRRYGSLLSLRTLQATTLRATLRQRVKLRMLYNREKHSTLWPSGSKQKYVRQIERPPVTTQQPRQMDNDDYYDNISDVREFTHVEMTV
eukprot:4090139-Amphidinium_carterae.1